MVAPEGLVVSQETIPTPAPAREVCADEFVLVASSKPGPSSRRALHSSCTYFQTGILPQPSPSIL